MNRVLIVAVLAVSAGAVPSVAVAQQPEPSAESKFAPVKTPTVTPDMLKTPPAALNAGSPSPKLGSNGKALPAPKLLPGVNIGKYDLELKAGRTRDIAPRSGYDSGELSNMESIRRGKQDSVTPDYFGLKLSAPTH